MSYFESGWTSRVRRGPGASVRMLIGGCSVVALLALGSGGSALAASTSPADAGSQRYIVVLRGPLSAEQVLDHATNDGATPQRTYSHAISGYSAYLSPQQRDRVKADPNVAMVVPDSPLHLTSSTVAPSPLASSPGNAHRK
jgi:shikimate 5-dehydrogenase